MPLLPVSADKVIGANGASASNKDAAIITTEALATASAATYTHTFNCPQITPNSIVLASVQNGSNAAGDPSLQLVTPGNGKATIAIVNRGAAAFNGSLIISVVVFN